MSDRIYNWKRFWCPRGATINLSDGGYLDDPDSQWGRIYNPEVKPFEAISETPCLALLGEPGIGKTRTIEAEREGAETRIKQEGDDILWLDLRSYGSEDRLVRNLFESEKFLAWIRGSHRLHVFLDSLDEGLLRIDTLAALLADEFKRYPVERLSLRIACRTAEWPSSLETELQQLWGEKAVGVYELVPLRRRDVVEAAKANGPDPDAFLAEISRAEVTPLAIKPVTLDFLLSTYQRHGSLPKTQAELYLEGCRLLCEETNKDRRAAQLTGDLSADQRLAVAARIAAVSIFANRYAVWTAVDQGEVPEEDVTVRELSSGREQARSDEFEVTENAVREALGTGLFSARGPNRLGWAHQTYAEFLATHYLVQRQMTLAQMMSLIVHPDDPEKKLIPQLHETAAWLAGIVPEVFREIVKSDPEVLLRSDVATAEMKDRVALVGALLERCNEEQSLLHHDWGVFSRFKKLSHPRLVEQLRSYICDTAKSQLARDVAIDIAEACGLRILQEDLAAIALDTSQHHRIRTSAAHAVVRIGSNEAKAKLRPLALGEAGDDPEDELKGYGLQALWPTHLTADELFTLLTLPKKKIIGGPYYSFLRDDLISDLRPEDLPVALRWVEVQQFRQRNFHPFEGPTNAIMLQAWTHLDTPGVLEAFVQAALPRLRNYENIFGDSPDPCSEDILDNKEKRRKLSETILLSLADIEKDLFFLRSSHPSLVRNGDIYWMIAHLRSATFEKIKRAWAQLIKTAINWQEAKQIDAVLSACQEEVILAEVCSLFFEPVQIDSPEAREAKERYLEDQKWQQARENRPLLKPSPVERFAALLEKYEAGDLSAWWQLNREMTLKRDSKFYGDEFEPDLTALPGWQEADLATRKRIVEAAKRYVLERDPETPSWLGTNILHHPAFAGYRALQLLLCEEPDWLFSVPADIWKKWAPIILAYPIANVVGKLEPQRELVKKAYQYAEVEIIECLIALIDQENESREKGWISITQKVRACWDDHLAGALLAKLKDDKLKPLALGCLLSELLAHNVGDAKTFAESSISPSVSPDEARRSKAIIAACALLTHADDAGWSIVWPAIQNDSKFGREVVSEVVYNAGLGRTRIDRMAEGQLADFYIWLARQYPHAEDPRSEGAHDVGSRESIADFRDVILRHLQERGTPQACEAIRRIARELPELDWLKWTLLEAQAVTRRQTWIPPHPEHILAIAGNQQGRLVQSGEQLLDVLVESLQELEKRLQGETPQAEFLWDRVEKNVYKPKDENSFSNYVKDHFDRDLRQRGVIANREVEIRRSMGARPGERVDIQIDAISKRPSGEEYDRISVVIEVKGCWHEELKQAMKTQLVDRYLKEARCQYGLYLVGWFNCAQWDDSDRRKQQTPKLSSEDTQTQFDAQAAELSRSGITVKAFVMNTALR